jgi:hypothetical protein
MTVVTFLTEESIVSAPLSELSLHMDDRYSECVIDCCRGLEVRRTNLLFRGTFEECQQALKVIFDFIARCGQIETPAIMISMKDVMLAVRK